jgi:hypothetical protein
LFVITSIARELQARGFAVWLQCSDDIRIAPGDADREFIQRGGAPNTDALIDAIASWVVARGY